MVLLEVALKAVDQIHRFTEHLLVLAAVHQNRFGPEHLRHLGQDGTAALGDEQIGKAADDRIGRDAAESVRAAAFEAHHQLAGQTGHARLSAHMSGHLLQQPHRLRHLVLHLLAYQKTHAVRIVFLHIGTNLVNAAVFAAQPQQQHAARVGMRGQIRQQPAGILLILPHLGAAIRMREGVYALHPSPHQRLRTTLQGAGHVVDTAHGGQNPQLVAHAHTPVPARIARKGSGSPGGKRLSMRVVLVFQLAGEQRAQIVHMHVASLRNIGFGLADGKAVFDHMLPFVHGVEGHLVAGGNVIEQRDGFPVNLDGIARLQGGERYGDRIVGTDFEHVTHGQPPKRSVITARMPRASTSFSAVATAVSSPGTCVRSCPKKSVLLRNIRVNSAAGF